MINEFISEYEKELEKINSNPDLNDSGKQRKVAELERKRKDDARVLIEKMRKIAFLNALSLRDAQNERMTKTGDAIKNLDYSRLNYEGLSLSAKIKGCETVEDVVLLWENAKRSNDAIVLKVWQDVAQGEICEFSDDYTDAKNLLLQDIRETKVELIKEPELTETEIQARNELIDVEKSSRLLGETLGYGENVVRRVFNKIGFDGGNIELGFDYQESVLPYDMGKRTETAEEVYNRVEREYQQNYDDYISAMKNRGFENSLDKDFDDLSGAF